MYGEALRETRDRDASFNLCRFEPGGLISSLSVSISSLLCLLLSSLLVVCIGHHLIKGLTLEVLLPRSTPRISEQASRVYGRYRAA